MGLVIISSLIKHQRVRQHFISFFFPDVSVGRRFRDRQLNITFSQLAVQVLRLPSRRRSDGTIADRDQDLTTPDRDATKIASPLLDPTALAIHPISIMLTMPGLSSKTEGLIS